MFFLITNESACCVSHDLKDDSEQSVMGNRNKTKYNCCVNKKKCIRDGKERIILYSLSFSAFIKRSKLITDHSGE